MADFTAKNSAYDGISDSDLMDKAQEYEIGRNGVAKDLAKAREVYGVLADRGNVIAKFKIEQLAKELTANGSGSVVTTAANNANNNSGASNSQKENEGGGLGSLLGALALAGAGYAAYKGVKNHNEKKEMERLRKEQEERETAEMGKKVAGLALGTLGNAIGGPVAGTLLGGLASLLTGDDNNGKKK